MMEMKCAGCGMTMDASMAHCKCGAGAMTCDDMKCTCSACGNEVMHDKVLCPVCLEKMKAEGKM